MGNKITCPHCQTEIDVEEILVHSIEDRYQAQFRKKEKELVGLYAEKNQKYTERLNELNEKNNNINTLIEEGVKRLSLEKEGQIKAQVRKEIELEIADFKNQVGENKAALVSLKQELLEAKKANRAAEKEKEDLKVDFEDQKESYAKQKMKEVQEKEEVKMSLKVREKELLIEQLNNQLIEAQKRIEQGSQERQGEAQEVELEKLLKQTYPFDKITEILKGQNGADVIQEVINIMQKSAGTIMYESKRTKKFSKDWVQKAKKDMRDRNADIAVIVTETLPDGWTRFGLMDGVWICSYFEIEAISLIMREMVLRIGEVEISQENKGTKMQYLYDFLTSAEFARLMTGIVEGFTSMQSQLESEKRSITAIWKKREKQIQFVTQNSIDMYGAIKSIAGKDLVTVAQLELPEELELD
jgi:hypothetical protein